MNKYHKIDSVYRRTTRGEMLLGEFACPEFEYLKDNKWVLTEKVDGTNIRVKSIDGKVEFAGKTDEAQLPSGLVKRLIDLFPLDKFDRYENDLCLYGEGYGAKIQKGGGNYKADGQDFVLFDVKVGDWWLERKSVESIAVELGIEVVPILTIATLPEMVILAQAGYLSKWGTFDAEGFVARPETELKKRNGDRVITKIKAKDFKRAISKRPEHAEAV